MNEVKLLNIGGIDQNIKDQYARDVIAPSENGLDSSTNLPVSSRHYDVGEYLIGQTRDYYEVIAEINVGDTIVVGTNVRATTVSDEIIALKNQSADTVIEIIADKENGALATQSYAVGKYIYWAYGLTAGLYIVTADISSGDALVSGSGGNIAPANKVCDDIKGLKENVARIDNVIENNLTKPNLIDNGWFTINQRGSNSYTGESVAIYTVDRWIKNQMTTLIISESGISVSALTDLWNRLELYIHKHLVGKKVTLSILLSDGTLYTATGLVTEYNGEYVSIDNDDVHLVYMKDQYFPFIWLQIKKSTIIVRAVKLEVGEISTLKVDTTPDYEIELAKCQRYFIRYGGDLYPDIGLAVESSGNGMYGVVNTPVPMRVRPSAYFNNLFAYKYYTNTSNIINNVRVDSISGNALKVYYEEVSNGVSGDVVEIQIHSGNGGHIDFSADL